MVRERAEDSNGHGWLRREQLKLLGLAERLHRRYRPVRRYERDYVAGVPPRRLQLGLGDLLACE